MNLVQYLEILCNDSPNPFYFTRVENKEIVFVNQSFKKKFQYYDDFTGKKCFEAFTDATGQCALCQGLEVKHDEFIENRVYSKALKSFLRSNSTLIDVQGETLLMTKFFLTSLDVGKVEAEHSFEEAMTQCLEILAHPEQASSIQSFLKMLCIFYTCELAFICEFDKQRSTLSSKYFWSNAEGETEVPLGQRDAISLEHFVSWLKNENDHEIVILDVGDTRYGPETTEYQILEKYEVSNITLSKLWNKDGSVLGIVGMSNRSRPIYDDRLLKAVSHFVVERFNEASTIKALESLNEKDLLTGFFNRNKYAEKLAQLRVNRPKSLGVLFINLNGLRRTNEYFGFEVGDIQIKNTAKHLRAFFTEDFYRISGDEFVGFIIDCEKAEFEEKVDALQLELKTSHHESSFAVGHSWATKSYDVNEQVKIADTTMLINKQVYYYNSLNNNEEITDSILSDLFRAIAEDEFLVYLQPQINLDTEEVVGAEALIRRFDRKNKKMIFPDDFIPLYERNSMIRHIDLYVMRKVCQILVDWKFYDQALPISVNLSRVTLMEHGIVKTITEIVDEYTVDHGLIVLEITERIGLVENEVASSLIDDFKSQGFRLSLDDFGCAYSNIVTLSQIEVDEVKIDKSLVDNLISNAKNRVIVKNMLLMCSELENTFSLAEGIETQEQADFLRSVHCHLGQGYLYSRPIPNEEFLEKYIKKLEEKAKNK